MTQIKERAFELIKKLPDDKIIFIVDILQDLDSLYADLDKEFSETTKSKKAYESLKKYRHVSDEERDYKEELAEIKEKRYESID